jgi:hypothetical protein
MLTYCECGNPLEPGQTQCDGCEAFEELDRRHHHSALGDETTYDFDEEDDLYDINRRSFWDV